MARDVRRATVLMAAVAGPFVVAGYSDFDAQAILDRTRELIQTYAPSST